MSEQDSALLLFIGVFVACALLLMSFVASDITRLTPAQVAAIREMPTTVQRSHPTWDRALCVEVAEYQLIQEYVGDMRRTFPKSNYLLLLASAPNALIEGLAAVAQREHPTWDHALCVEEAKLSFPHSERGGLSEDLVASHSDWPWGIIVEQKISLGMTHGMVLTSLGSPSDINRSVGSWGVHEQWVYRTGDYSANYLYFEDGILTSWSD